MWHVILIFRKGLNLFNLLCPSLNANGLCQELIDREKILTNTVLCEMYLDFIDVRTRFFGPKLNYYMINDEKKIIFLQRLYFWVTLKK